MSRPFALFGFLARFLLATALMPVLAPSGWSADLIEEDLRLPARFDTPNGPRILELEAHIVRPDDGARHPLVLLSHGSPRLPEDRPTMSPLGMLPQAREFARRGWATVSVLRRGYGHSDGPYAETGGSCDKVRYEPIARISAQDLRETIRLMGTQPYVDASRILAVGLSAGGLATVALTADPPPGLLAAISFAGGRGSMKPDFVCNAQDLVDAYASFGRTSRIPMLWVYAENDHFFSPDLAQRFHQAFVGSGGQARLIMAPPFRDDGHGLFSGGGIPLWTPYVDEFLNAHGLRMGNPPPPLTMRRRPAPSQLSASGREAFAQFQDAPPHKAFAMAPNGAYGWRSGRDSAETARTQAIAACRQYTPQPCQPIMIDDE